MEAGQTQPPPGLQARLDRWWPTVLRYTGWLIVLYGVLADGAQHPVILVVGGGMVGLKEFTK